MSFDQPVDDDESTSSSADSHRQDQISSQPIRLPHNNDSHNDNNDDNSAHASSSRQTVSPTTRRPLRLTNRSRAGCWTCRGRKVKCDEVHPRCGPCQRLNRECDWGHRWNFTDATNSTQSRYRNVDTLGNVVWDPQARSPVNASPTFPPPSDTLPSFSTLTNNDDRERKAETHPPGTFGVVVTPESFADLPEYSTMTSPSSRRASQQWHGTPISSSPSPSLTRAAATWPDPHVVVLGRFEETATTIPLSASSRRSSVPEALHRLSIQTPAHQAVLPHRLSTIPAHPSLTDDVLVRHFRRYLIPRLVQPLVDRNTPDRLIPGATQDVFEIEASRYPPLHHAICAVSALHLTYSGRTNLENALQHYHRALTVSAPVSDDDLLSDGVFLRHFLLFIYDICVPVTPDSDGVSDGMWTQHLTHLRRLTVQRHSRYGREPHAYIVWRICELDMCACLLGNGNADFIRTIIEYDLLPPIEQQIPSLGAITGPQTLDGPYLPEEARVFPPILSLQQGIVIQVATLAQAAQAFRAIAEARSPPTPSMYANWQANVSRIQNDLFNFWTHAYPDSLPSDFSQTSSDLPPRPKHVFEHAHLLFQAAVIYTRTSMFPGQRLLPTANATVVQADTERRCQSIFQIASTIIHGPPHNSASPIASSSSQRGNSGSAEQRYVVFALFVAGIAASSPESRRRAIDLIGAFERAAPFSASALAPPASTASTTTTISTTSSSDLDNESGSGLRRDLFNMSGARGGGGIGQNTSRTRQLLGEVFKRQAEEVARGGRAETVEWFQVAKEHGLGVVNCGL